MTLRGRYADVTTTGRPYAFMPTPSLEWWYFAQVFYSILGPVLGLSVGFLGIGGLGLLTVTCVIRMGKYATAILRPAIAPLACGVVFVGVQVAAHGESLQGSDGVREIIGWTIGTVVVQYLALRRGFLHRFAIFAFLIGLLTLPYMKTFGGDATRTGLDKSITIANPNDFGAWFGFCCVYFTILGLEARRNWIRIAAWVSAIVCLLVIGLTVSRAPLFAAAFSAAIALRRVLKRGFLPLAGLIALAWLGYALGLFEQSAALYAERGLQETGRLLVWPLAVERYLHSPFVGVGERHVATYLPTAEISIQPHNGFIFIALAAGIVPLLLFVGYWVQLFATVLRSDARSHDESPFQISLVVYCFLIVFNLNGAFMMPWVMVALASVTGTSVLLNARQAVLARASRGPAIGRHGTPALAGRSRA